jgi:hypothetical protein
VIDVGQEARTIPIGGSQGGRAARHAPARERPAGSPAHPKPGWLAASRRSARAALFDPASLSGTLIGVAVGLIVTGLCAVMSSGVADRSGAVVCGCLVALAIGVRLPQELAVRISRVRPRKRRRGRRAITNGGEWSSIDEGDRAFQWMVMSVVALVAGLVTSGLLGYLRIGFWARGVLESRFLWSESGQSVLAVILALGVSAGPLAMLGLSLSCAHRVGGDRARWNPFVSAWFTVGVAVGVLMARVAIDGLSRPGLSLMAAPIPVLLVALSAVRLGSSSAIRGRRRWRESGALPLIRDHWPTLVRGTCVAAGGCVAWMIVSWWAVAGGHGSSSGFYIPAALASVGLGFFLGTVHRWGAVRSLGGFGVACAAAGLLGGCAMSVALPGEPSRAGPAWFFPLVGVGAGGYATAYGLMVIFNRVAGRSQVGVRVLWRILLVAALIAAFGAPACRLWIGAAGSLALGPIALVAVGGIVILHEPCYSPRTRWLRIAGVFAATCLIVWLIPPSPDLARSRDPASTAQRSVRPVSRGVLRRAAHVGAMHPTETDPPHGQTESQEPFSPAR